MWLSLVERLVRDQEVAGSTPVTPTSSNRFRDKHLQGGLLGRLVERRGLLRLRIVPGSAPAPRSATASVVEVRRGARALGTVIGDVPLDAAALAHLARAAKAADVRLVAVREGRVVAGFGRWSTAIRDGLRALHTAGHLAPDIDPDDLAVTLLAALQGGLLLAQVQRDTRPLRTTLDTLLALAAAT